MKNPFVYGGVVSRENYLKRPKEEKFIKESIENNQNIFITGERRTGKTSTVMVVIKSSLKQSYIHADFYGIKSESDIAKKLVDAIGIYRTNNFGIEDALKSLARFRVAAETKSNGSGIELVPYLKKDNYADDIEAALRHIHEISKKKKIAIFFDEFQEIKNIKDFHSILGRMRSIIQYINEASFIFTGSIRKKMDHIFRDSQYPFFKSALPLDFPKIEEDRMYKFVNEKMMQKNINITQDSFDRLYKITNGIIGDIQQFCKIAFSYLEVDATIDMKLFTEILHELFKLEEKFYNYTLYESSLTKLQMSVLCALAKYDTLGYQSNEFKEIVKNYNSNAIDSTIKALERHNIIYIEGRKVFFFNPYFREWLKK